MEAYNGYSTQRHRPLAKTRPVPFYFVSKSAILPHVDDRVRLRARKILRLLSFFSSPWRIPSSLTQKWKYYWK